MLATGTAMAWQDFNRGLGAFGGKFAEVLSAHCVTALGFRV